MYTAEQCYEFALLLLCIWREARGETMEAKKGVAWCIRNRVMKEGRQWYGDDWTTVILKPYQFSSFNANDPNATKLPLMSDPSFKDCLTAAKYAYNGMAPDPTQGATYYFDDSLAANPPKWAKTFTPTVKIGRLNFFKETP
jgi:spore germination cell wall hydrolase CwlJ-like protein